MLELEQVSFAYGDKPVLNQLSFTFQSPGAYAVLGPSGCGKTTLLYLLSGLLNPTSGVIQRTDAARIAFCFQEDRLIPQRTVLENVALVCSGTLAERTARAREWLQRVGLTASADMLPAELSGGMQRRTALARALAFDAPILLLDEPFRALDAKAHTAMRTLVHTFSRNRLLILVTHDEADAQGMQPLRLFPHS